MQIIQTPQRKQNKSRLEYSAGLDCVDPVIVWLPVVSYFQLKKKYFYFNRIKTFGHGNVYYIVVMG